MDHVDSLVGERTMIYLDRIHHGSAVRAVGGELLQEVLGWPTPGSLCSLLCPNGFGGKDLTSGGVENAPVFFGEVVRAFGRHRSLPVIDHALGLGPGQANMECEGDADSAPEPDMRVPALGQHDAQIAL